MNIFHGMILEFLPHFRIQKIDGLAYYFADALLSRSLIASPSPSFVGLSSTLKEVVQKRDSFFNNQGNRNDLAIFILFFAPIFSVILLNSVLYNGWRHLYFIYPAMVWIGILGLKWYPSDQLHLDALFLMS